MTEYVTLSPEDVAETLGTSAWWVREQARRGRIPHLRLGKGRIRLLPEHVDALVALFTVEGAVAAEVPPLPSVAAPDVAVLRPTARSVSAHRRRPHVDGEVHLF